LAEGQCNDLQFSLGSGCTIFSFFLSFSTLYSRQPSSATDNPHTFIGVMAAHCVSVTAVHLQGLHT